ncbi:LacI family DNA-binding transcriptional regulator [Paenibacillus assamensis]|uniref:LacI family DNA-binding transcriptional regulator n=1 Tax=Paenibacillus assamensis TaxID=311244 RepID=UPI00041BA53A|nr:LacI family DNA-binding transcriptional regulator [Paenibacillus assamensis]
MTRKITQQHIADAMKLSRNTVSKALNNEPGLREDTRLRIIQQAVDMGYTKLPPDILEQLQAHTAAMQPERASATGNRIISLLSHSDYVNNSYWSQFLKGMNAALKEHRYMVTMTLVDREDEQALQLPDIIAEQQSAGLVMIGPFLKEYYQLIAQSDIPALFVDTYASFSMNELCTDVMLVNNEDSVYRITSALIAQGHRKLGFVGDIGSCLSFQERWLGFKRAMQDHHLLIEEKYGVTSHDPMHQYNEHSLRQALAAMKERPTAFICVNDEIALTMLHLLRQENREIPEEIMLTGFDHIAEISLIHPTLPTVIVPMYEMGMRAAEQLMWRMRYPERPYELIRLAAQVCNINKL